MAGLKIYSVTCGCDSKGRRYFDYMKVVIVVTLC